MPRVRRRSKLRRAGYNEHHRGQLLHGSDVFGDAFGNGDDMDVEAFKAAWELFRDRLLSEWIAANPGTRPAAWWILEAPEPRRRIDGIQHPFADRIRRQRVEAMPAHYFARRHVNDLYFGLPRVIFTRGESTAKYETEAAYLHRLGLLTDAERAELFP